jgi:glutamate-1-semialdehyde 2,1-aminomutase
VLSARVAAFAAALSDAVRTAGVFAHAPTAGPLMGLFLSPGPCEVPGDFAGSRTLGDNGLYARFFHAMLARGVALAPGAYEIVFVSMAHDDHDLERAVNAAGDAAREVL